MKLGRTIELVQRHRAEEDAAVAAASILARMNLSGACAVETQFGVKTPQGASAAVEAAGREFVSRHGPDALPKVAKMHFRTSFRVLGLPEPPKDGMAAGSNPSEPRPSRCSAGAPTPCRRGAGAPPREGTGVVRGDAVSGMRREEFLIALDRFLDPTRFRSIKTPPR